jgi:hypothetical protein
MSLTIEIRVDPTGQVQVQARGFTGSTCRHATAGLIQALGLPLQEQLEPEYFQPSSMSLTTPTAQQTHAPLPEH